jgi:hypothetical protein
MNSNGFQFNPPPTNLWADQNNFNDPRFQIYLCAVHAVSEEAFLQMLNAYSSEELYPPKVYSAKEIYLHLAPLPPSGILYFSIGELYDITNKNISCSDFETPISTGYSVAYMRGLLQLFPFSDFEFFKARKNDTETIIFRIVQDDQIVYLGDSSEIFP